MSIQDFKTLSLHLFGKEVIVIFKENSPSYKIYQGSLKGVLIGRIWGEKLVNGQKQDTVIAVTIQTNEGEKEIFSAEVFSIKEHTTNINQVSINFA